MTLHNTFDRVSMSIHFHSRIVTEIEVNITAGFCLGLALATGFPDAVSSSVEVGIDSCHVSVNAIHDSDPQDGVVLK